MLSGALLGVRRCPSSMRSFRSPRFLVPGDFGPRGLLLERRLELARQSLSVAGVWPVTLLLLDAPARH